MQQKKLKLTSVYLRHRVQNSLFTEQRLATYLTEIESPINGRPLKVMNDDVNNIGSLTLNHFLLPRNNPKVDIFIPQDNPSKFCSLQWIAEYLLLLTQRKECSLNIRDFYICDLVVVAHKNLSCANWPLGRDVKIFSGSDVVIRVAKVKT